MQIKYNRRKSIFVGRANNLYKRPKNYLGRSRLWLLVLLVPLFIGLSMGNTKAEAGTVVSLSVDGVRHGFSTDAKNVADVLARAQIRLSKNDLVEPSLETNINTGIFYINVYRAKPAIVVDGKREINVRTPYTNPKLIAQKSAKIKIYPEDGFEATLNRDFIADQTLGHRVIIKRAVPVKLSVDGKNFKLRTNKQTVEELLAEKGVVTDKDDKVKPGLKTKLKPGMHVRVIRVGTETVAVEEVVAFDIQTIFDNNKPDGYEEVRQQGRNGRQLVTYKVRYHNGRVVSRKVLQRVVTKQPVTKIVVRGQSYAGGVWEALRFCESGGDYTKNTGNGYYGAYQFSYSTWQSMGTGYEYPHQAPPGVQDAAAQKLQARSGWGQWPHCASKLGLL